MAKLALTVGGMALGFAIGGPFGAQIGAMVGGMVGNMLFSPSIKGPRLTDLTVTASTYGQTIPELYGTMRLGGNLIWTAGIKEKKHKSGGKGGPKQTTYTYSASFAIAFCKGEVDGVLRLWADGKLIAGAKPGEQTNGEVLAVSGILNLTKKKKGKFKYRFYNGSENQSADSTILAKEGSGNAPAYRDLAYIVFKDMPLEDFGNRIPQITAEITRNPEAATPYVKFNAETPLSDWYDSGAQVDWDGQQFYKYDPSSHEFVTFDLRTMQEIFRVPAQDTGLSGYPSNHKPSFSVSGDYFFDDISDTNSGYNCFWSAKTGQFLGHFGYESTSLSQDPMGNNTGTFTPESAHGQTYGRSDWFRVLTLGGQEDYCVIQGNVSDQVAIWTPGLEPVYFTGNSIGGNTTYRVLRGKENLPTPLPMGPAGNSDLLLVHDNGSSGFILRKINFPALSRMELPSGPPWQATNPLLASLSDTGNVVISPPAGTFTLKNVAYDKSDNSLVVWGHDAGDWRFGKWLIEEEEWAWYWKDSDYPPEWDLNGGNGAYPVRPADQSNLDGLTVGWKTNDSAFHVSYIYVADLQTGRLLKKLDDPIPTYGDEDGWTMTAWDDQSQSILGAPTRIFVGEQGAGISLRSIVDDIMTKTQALTPGADWDSSDLDGITVHGYTISRDASARDCLYQLASAYFFDGVESDYIVKFVKRGKPSVATIHEKHLAWTEGRDISLKETRAQEVELPMRVTVTYADIERDYQDGTQSAKRNSNPFPTMHSHTEQKFELPIAMQATDAKQIADKSLKMAWSGRWNYKMKLPWEFLKYDPTDVITVESDEGYRYEMRLNKIGLGVDFTSDVDGVSEKPAAYTSVAVGDPGTGVPIQEINVGGPVTLQIMNTPLLQDSDDTQGVASVFYVTAHSKTPGDFKVAYIFEGDPTGSEYEDIGSVATEPTWGTCLTALPPHTRYGLDPFTVLRVRMMSLNNDDSDFDTLESITEDDLLAGKNAALVGGEIIQFMTAEVEADGRTWRLTNLLRARRGTNYKVIDHEAGEAFIMLSSDTISRQINQPTEWDAQHTFKGVASGEYVENVIPQVINMDPNDLKPYTPEQVKVSDDGTDVTITFERRSRISNELKDSTGDIPYREGQGSLAKFVYKVYANKDLLDEPWDGDTPDFTGDVPIYSGTSFAPLTFDFPLAGITEFVAEIYEVGFANGFPKLVHFKRIHPNDWDFTELY